MTQLREQYKAEINKAYPHLNEFFVNVILDLYFQEGGKEKIETIVKDDKKKQMKIKNAVVKNEDVVFNGIAVINPPELISIE